MMDPAGPPEFVGSILGDGVELGTAFACYDTRLLVTCEHVVPKDVSRLEWQPFLSPRPVELSRWRTLIRDDKRDIAVIANSVPLHPSRHLAFLPREPVAHSLEVFFHGLGMYEEEGVPYWRRDVGDGTLTGSNGLQGDARRYKLKSQDITKGFSGSPVLYHSGVGITVVGMVTGKYSTPEHANRDTAWVVPADWLGSAVLMAWHMLEASDPSKSHFDQLNIKFDPVRLRICMRESSTSERLRDRMGETKRDANYAVDQNGIYILRMGGFETTG
jgi:hypothetical protein